MSDKTSTKIQIKRLKLFENALQLLKMLEYIMFRTQGRKLFMFRFKSPNLLAFIILPLVVFGAACYSNESNSRWANAQRESAQGANPAATTTTAPAQTQNAPNRPPRSSKPRAGGEFNKFFPLANEGGYTRVASQEKDTTNTPACRRLRDA